MDYVLVEATLNKLAVIASADEDGGADGSIRPPPSDALTTKQSPHFDQEIASGGNPPPSQ
jgi:hypothetical protein